jgi:hypothetical protein
MRKLFSIVSWAVLLLIFSAPGAWAQQNRVWELGTYPNGTWAVMGDINDFGLAVGQAGLPDGSAHSLAVSLFGPRAGGSGSTSARWVGRPPVGKRASFRSLTQA